MKILLTCLGLAGLLLLGACSTPPAKPGDAMSVSWGKQQSLLEQIQQWDISGRIAVQTSDTGGQADFSWQQSTSEYRIRLQAPLGAGTTWIEGDVHGVVVRTSSGESLADSDVDSLLYQINGWPLPVSGLYYWVRGIPSPASSHRVTLWHDNAMPEVIEQDGWRIEFRSHNRVNGMLLPRKLFISRLNEEDGQQVDVRLIIRQWEMKDV